MNRILTFVATASAGCAILLSVLVSQVNRSDKPLQANAVVNAIAPIPAAPAPASNVYGLAKAFAQAETFTGKVVWRGNNTLQNEFVRDFIGLDTESSAIPKSMLAAIASPDADEVNGFLKSNGLTMQLKPFKPGSFGAASVLSIDGKWQMRVVAREITAAGKNYPGLYLSFAFFYRVAGHNEPVVLLYQHDKLSVYATPWDGADEGFNAVRKARELTPSPTADRDGFKYNRLSMPMVDMDRNASLDWLIDLQGGNRTVNQALSQTKLRLDEFGFGVKDGVAIEDKPTGPKPTEYKLDKPFLFWITYEGLSYPLFAVKVDERFWIAPPTSKAK